MYNMQYALKSVRTATTFIIILYARKLKQLGNVRCVVVVVYRYLLCIHELHFICI